MFTSGMLEASAGQAFTVMFEAPQRRVFAYYLGFQGCI